MLQIIVGGGATALSLVLATFLWRRRTESARRRANGAWIGAYRRRFRDKHKQAERELAERWRIVDEYEMPPPLLSRSDREPLDVDEIYDEQLIK